MTGRPPPRILSIAGSDSSGGAGIQADIKTITVLGGYAMTAITAVTAQNTTGVQGVELLPTQFVAQQIDSCLGDIGADAVKIGMLGSPEIAAIVADRLEGFSGPVVFDPVMVATSGAVLADAQTIAAFERLMRLSSVVTPNLPELAVLAGAPLPNDEAVITAAVTLARKHGTAVLAKGGHGAGERLTDRLVGAGGGIASWTDARIETRHTHGTGCTLAAALATLLGHGQPLENAVRLARSFTRRAIAAAPGFGAGAGPLGHAGAARAAS